MGRHHRKTRRHHRRGGSGVAASAAPAAYTSASTWMNAINGSEDAQYGRVFNQSSPFPANGNAIIGAQGQRAGRGRRRHRTRHRRRHSRRHGGTMGAIGTALAPIALIGLNQKFGRSHRRRN